MLGRVVLRMRYDERDVVRVDLGDEGTQEMVLDESGVDLADAPLMKHTTKPRTAADHTHTCLPEASAWRS